MYNKNSAVIKSLLKFAGGNPGSLSVVMKLLENNDQYFLNILTMSLFLTESQNFELWEVYNDECGQDLDKTKSYLFRWIRNSDLSLGEYMESNK